MIIIMNDVERLRQIIQASGNIVFFGGAGVSTESGIPDFRSSDGLYTQKFKYPPEIMLSHSFFVSHTEEFFDFYRAKILHTGAKPNAAHLKLAELEREGTLKAVITQNIDGLHTIAGSRNVIELHGSIHRNYCVKCGKLYGMEFIQNSTGVPLCSCGGIVKPDVVLYEESLDGAALENSVKYIANADVLIVGGTSLAVYPAAGLLDYYSGNKLVLINKTATPCDSKAALAIHAGIGETLGSI